jgi:hypothetical protein
MPSRSARGVGPARIAWHSRREGQPRRGFLAFSLVILICVQPGIAKKARPGPPGPIGEPGLDGVDGANGVDGK